MKKESCIKLLNLLKKYNIKFQDENIPITPEQLFDLPELVVNEMLNANSDYQIKTIIEMLNKWLFGHIEMNNAYLGEYCKIINTLDNEFKATNVVKLIKCAPYNTECGARLSYEGTTIISKCTKNFQVKNATIVLTTKDTISAGIALEGAKIIAGCEEEYQAENTQMVLTNKYAIETGIALEGAKIIAGCEKNYQAEYVRRVLCDEDATKTGIALDGARLIVNCKEEFQADYASKILCSPNANVAGVALDGAVQVTNSKESHQAYRISTMLTTQQIRFEQRLIFSAIPFINIATEEQANEMMNAIQENGHYIAYEKAIEKLQQISGHKIFGCEKIDDMTIDEALLMMNEEIFDLPDEVDAETVKLYIKKNDGKKILFPSKN